MRMNRNTYASRKKYLKHSQKSKPRQFLARFAVNETNFTPLPIKLENGIIEGSDMLEFNRT